MMPDDNHHRLDRIFSLERHFYEEGSAFPESSADIEYLRETALDFIKELPDPLHFTPHPVKHEVPEHLRKVYDNVKEPETWYSALYHGYIGAIWGLYYCDKALNLKTGYDFSGLAEQSYNHFIKLSARSRCSSYFFGELGFVVFLYLITGSSKYKGRIKAILAFSSNYPSNELFWGDSGYALVSVRLYEYDGDTEWLKLLRGFTESIWNSIEDSHSGFKIWYQNLDGVVVPHIGVAHGFMGNMKALLAGLKHLPIKNISAEYLEEICYQTLISTKTEQNGLFNWPQSVESIRPDRSDILMQWCHGAPGIVTSFQNHCIQHDNLRSLVITAAESVWTAGPLNKKYGGYCHGTSGNGYSFLDIQTQDLNDVWKKRSLIFAGSVVKQLKSISEDEKRGYKFSLWTGNVGDLVYLCDVINNRPGMLTLDKLL